MSNKFDKKNIYKQFNSNNFDWKIDMHTLTTHTQWLHESMTIILNFLVSQK